AQFFIPSSGSCPARVPEKQITLGKPASLVFSIALRICARQSSQLAFLLRPLLIPWLLVIEPTKPYFLSVGNSSGVTRSIPLNPSFAVCLHKSSSGILSYYHWQTVCLLRFF